MLNVNNVSRKAVSFGVSKIPEAGEMISSLIDALWPEDEDDVWTQIKDQMETFVDQKLDTLVFNQVTGRLDGLRLVLGDYREAVADSTSNLSYVTEHFNTASDLFNAMQNDFKTSGYELVLLPLFAQMVNLHLALLRDGAIYGASWNWSPKIVADLLARIDRFATADVAWVEKWFSAGLAAQPELPATVSSAGHLGNLPLWNFGPDYETPHLASKQWNIFNTYRRQMALQVTDYAHYWPYFNPSKGLAPKLTREIYSDLQGTADFHTHVLPDSTVRDRLSWLNVWAWDWPYGLQASYRPEWNPLRAAEMIPDIGNAAGEAAEPHGCSVAVTPASPIVEVHGRSGDLINQVGFTFRDGHKVRCGGYGGGSAFTWAFDGHILSQVYSTGLGHDSVIESMVFGFRLEDSYVDTHPRDTVGVAARMMGSDYTIGWRDDDSGESRGGYVGWGTDLSEGGAALMFNQRRLLKWGLVGDDSLEWTDEPQWHGSASAPFAAHLTFFAGDGSTLPGDQISGWVQMTADGPKIPMGGSIERDDPVVDRQRPDPRAM